MSKVDLKVVMLGHEYVGKTSLVERFIYKRFTGDVPYQVTIGAVFVAKPVVSSNGKKIVVGLWDTAGSERYQAMSRIYYRGSKAAIVCYDVSSKVSWQRAKFWVSELRKNVEDCKIYICGTKIDMVTEGIVSREVELEDVEKYVSGILSKYFETSSKTGQNVDELFQTIVDEFVLNPGNSALNAEIFQLHDDVPKHKCC